MSRANHTEPGLRWADVGEQRSNLGYKQHADGAYSVLGVTYQTGASVHFQMTENVIHSVSGPLHLAYRPSGNTFSLHTWVAGPTNDFWFSVQFQPCALLLELSSSM